MKTFLKIFGVIVAIIIAVGLVLDNKVDVSRQVEINASAEQVHRYVNDLEKWPEWSPWIDLDPTMKTVLGKKTTGVGASQSWHGQSGAGALTFTQSSASEGVVYDMTFEGDSTIYTAGLRYQEQNGKTLVTWYMQGEMEPIIIGNYFAQFMDGFVGDSFASGLEKLKNLAEAN